MSVMVVIVSSSLQQSLDCKIMSRIYMAGWAVFPSSATSLTMNELFCFQESITPEAKDHFCSFAASLMGPRCCPVKSFPYLYIPILGWC